MRETESSQSFKHFSWLFFCVFSDFANLSVVFFCWFGIHNFSHRQLQKIPVTISIGIHFLLLHRPCHSCLGGNLFWRGFLTSENLMDGKNVPPQYFKGLIRPLHRGTSLKISRGDTLGGVGWQAIMLVDGWNQAAFFRGTCLKTMVLFLFWEEWNFWINLFIPKNSEVCFSSCWVIGTNPFGKNICASQIKVELLMEEILHHLGCLKPVVNNGINYQPQLVQDFFHQQKDWFPFQFFGGWTNPKIFLFNHQLGETIHG